MTLTRDDKRWLYQLAEAMVVALRGDALYLRGAYEKLLSGEDERGEEVSRK